MPIIMPTITQRGELERKPNVQKDQNIHNITSILLQYLFVMFVIFTIGYCS